MLSEPVTEIELPLITVNDDSKRRRPKFEKETLHAPEKSSTFPCHNSSVDAVKVPSYTDAVEVYKDTVERRVTADDKVENTRAEIRIPLDTSNEPPVSVNTSKKRAAGLSPREKAVVVMLFAPPTRVRLLTPPNVPEREKDDDTDALSGRRRRAPETTVMVESWLVSSSREAKAHSCGSAGRVLLAALVSDATKPPAAVTPSTLVASALHPVHP